MTVLFKIFIILVYTTNITAYETGRKYIGDKYSYVLNINNFEAERNCTGAQIDTYWVLTTDDCAKLGTNKVSHAVWAMLPVDINETVVGINATHTPPDLTKPKNRTIVRSLATRVFKVGNGVSLIKLLWPTTLKPAAGLGLIPSRYDASPIKFQDLTCTSVGYTKKEPEGPPRQIFLKLNIIGKELCCELKTTRDTETANNNCEGAPLICQGLIIGFLNRGSASGSPRKEFCFVSIFGNIKQIISTIVRNDYTYKGQTVSVGHVNENKFLITLISVIFSLLFIFAVNLKKI